MALDLRIDNRCLLDMAYENTPGSQIPRAPVLDEVVTRYRLGTGANQCNSLYVNAPGLVSGTTTYELAAGSLKDAFGQGMTWTKVRGIRVKMLTVTAGITLSLAGDFVTARLLTGTSPAKVIGSGGVFYEESPVDGYAVGTSADTITVTVSSGQASFELAMWGQAALAA